MSESDTSEEACEGLLKKALKVDFPENFDPNSVPQNGEIIHSHLFHKL